MVGWIGLDIRGNLGDHEVDQAVKEQEDHGQEYSQAHWPSVGVSIVRHFPYFAEPRSHVLKFPLSGFGRM